MGRDITCLCCCNYGADTVTLHTVRTCVESQESPARASNVVFIVPAARAVVSACTSSGMVIAGLALITQTPLSSKYPGGKLDSRRVIRERGASLYRSAEHCSKTNLDRKALRHRPQVATPITPVMHSKTPLCTVQIVLTSIAPRALRWCQNHGACK